MKPTALVLWFRKCASFAFRLGEQALYVTFGQRIISSLGSHNYSPTLILVIALESLLFIGIGLWRFSREEF